MFAAHSLALNEVEGEAAQADWAAHGDQLSERGPWDLVLAADVVYTRVNVEAATRLLPRLGAQIRLADPNRNGARHLLAAVRHRFRIETERGEDVSLHTLTPRRSG